MSHELLMCDKNLVIGQKKAQRESDLSVYEGKVPLHERLVLLCQDFLESVSAKSDAGIKFLERLTE